MKSLHTNNQEKFLKWLPIALFASFVPSIVYSVMQLIKGNWLGNYSLYYYVGYETGFGGRKLIGTICSWFFPEHITAHFMWGVILCAVCIMIALFVWFVTRCVHRSIPNAMATVAVTILYAVLPFSIFGFLQARLAVYFIDTYHFILTFIWLLLFMRYRGKWHFYIITAIIAGAACLIHHTFCCTLFPLFVALFLYDTIDGAKIDWHKAAGYGLICISLLALLVIIWTQSHMNVDIDTLSARIGDRVDPDAYYRWEDTDSALYVIFYASNALNREIAFNMLSARDLYFDLVLTIILMLPFLVLFWKPWFMAAKRVEMPLLKWRYRLVPIVISVITLPIFFIATDYSRWFAGYFFSLFAVTMVPLALGDKALTHSWCDLLAFFRRRPWIALVLIVYAIQLHLNFFSGLDLAIRIRKMVFSILGLESNFVNGF